MDDLFPALEVDTDDYIQLKLEDYKAMCDTLIKYQNEIDSYEAVITRLKDLVNAQDAAIDKIKDLVQQTHTKISQKPKIKKIDSIDF